MSDRVPSLAEEVGEEVLQILASRRKPRGSTYRLQFNREFTFKDATAIVPYLQSLGITHVYASPYLRAQTGSVHGYDVCQHDQFNPEIGTVEDFAALATALKEHDLGHVLDTVPNHMAASSENPWWMDVLENGPSSPFSHYFDIDWSPVTEELRNKVLLPILGDQFGQVLEAGQLLLERREGGLVLCYFDHVLPINPTSVLPLLQYRIEELKATLSEASDPFLEYQSIITALQHLPPASATSPEQMTERQREKEVIKRRIRRLESEQPVVAEFLEQNVQEFNGTPGDPRTFDRLEELLRAQAYRLCHWRSASDEVNYRRFFDINGLAAMCVESADVFEHSHRLVMQLLARGDVDGLRIDHIDGLLDPTRYLWRLQWAYLAELGWRVFAQRTGSTLSDDLAQPAVLAIARPDDASAPAGSAVAAEALTAAEIAGAIGAVVMEQAAADRQSTATLEVPPEMPRWSELRPLLMHYLCDRLAIPYPDRDLLSGAAWIHGQEEPADENVYQQPINNANELPLYVVVEKILGPDEPLPDTWPVAGTSGYDFAQLLGGLLLDPQGLRQVMRGYERFIGEKLEFSEVVYHCKLLILRFSMSSELQMLAHRCNRISEHHRRSRDFTLNMIRHALREVLASFPVYRTYAGPSGVSDRDKRFVNLAIARAKRRSPAADAGIFEFIRRVLLLEHPEGLSDEDRLRRELFAGRFQQVTSPVMAKGTEDTAFYQYCPLVSVNEVGSHPDVAPVSVESFHQDNAARLGKFPTSMLGTSTHDTKRSEDLRARINVLAEIPHVWRKACNRWLRLNRKFHREVDGSPAPTRNDEYLFYQTLVGFWPPEPPSEAEHPWLVDRLQAYMEKATHEAKVSTSWVNPNAPYDEALREFVGKVLERRKDNRFLAELAEFNGSLLDWGLYSAVAQAALKIMSPGVPDIYQGQELWDFSLVDPDNRRAVDYGLRRHLLDELRSIVQQGTGSQKALARQLAASPRDPRLKLYTTWRLLQLRRSEPGLFLRGKYVPLQVSGSAERHVCAFTWQFQPAGHEVQQAIVVIPRLLAQLATATDSAAAPHPLWNAETWGDTRVNYVIPAGRKFRSVFTGDEVASSPALSVAELLKDFPIAVLTNF